MKKKLITDKGDYWMVVILNARNERGIDGKSEHLILIVNEDVDLESFNFEYAECIQTKDYVDSKENLRHVIEEITNAFLAGFEDVIEVEEEQILTSIGFKK